MCAFAKEAKAEATVFQNRLKVEEDTIELLFMGEVMSPIGNDVLFQYKTVPFYAPYQIDIICEELNVIRDGTGT